MSRIYANRISSTVTSEDKDNLIEGVTGGLTDAQKSTARTNIGVATESFGQKVSTLTSTGIPSLISYNITGVTYNAVSDKVIATTSLAGTIAKGAANAIGGIDWTTQGTLTSTAWTRCVSSETVTIVATNATAYNYSTDGGTTWLSGTFPQTILNLAYGNGKFLAIYSNNTYATSTDGVTWGTAQIIAVNTTVTACSFLKYSSTLSAWIGGFTANTGATYLWYIVNGSGNWLETGSEQGSTPYTSAYPYGTTGLAATYGAGGIRYGSTISTVTNTSTLAVFQRTVTDFAYDGDGNTLFVNSNTSLPHFFSDNSLYLSDIKNESGSCVCYAGGSFKQFVIGCANGRFQHTQRGA